MVVSCKSYLWYWCIWMCLRLLFQDRFYRNSVLWLAFVEVNFTSSPFAYGSVPNFILEDTLRPKHNLETWPFDSQQFLICLMLSCSFWVVDSGILRWDANDSDDCWRCANGKSYLVFDVSQTGSNNLGKRSFFLRVLYLWFTDSTGLVSCLCCLFDWKIVHLLEFCWGEALLVQATMWRSFNLLWLQMMYWMSIGVSP